MTNCSKYDQKRNDSTSVDVSVLVVSYNTRRLLDECLASILAETRCAHEIVVVDNASTDGSASMVRRRYPGVTVVANEGNVGFAAATNQASQLAQGRYLFCLNPDTVILSGAIDKLVAFMDAHPTVGVCGPRNVDEQGEIRRNGYFFSDFRSAFWTNMHYTPLRPLAERYRHSRRYSLDDDQPQEVDVVQGCSLMIRADLYRQLGGMDEGFFLYFEEMDLCYRVNQARYSVVYLPQAELLHYRADSNSQDAIRIYQNIGIHYLQSRYHYLAKTYGRRFSSAMRVVDLGTGLALAVGAALRREPQARARTLARGRLFRTVALGQPTTREQTR